tara:strand:- start:227 stop:748 length:522 start_codon:yes stop_codon:yes gene_type:complete
MSYKTKLKSIKNFVFDVDGVFTDGSITVDINGNELRQFSTRDGIAVKLATDLGYKICVISGGNNEGVRKRLNRLGVKEVFLGVDNKQMIYNEFLDKHNLNNSETVFMGDDLPDITILQVCGLSSCPNDACPEVRSIVEYISIKNGGMGCVRDIIEQTLKAQGKWKLNETSKNI